MGKVDYYVNSLPVEKPLLRLFLFVIIPSLIHSFIYYTLPSSIDKKKGRKICFVESLDGPQFGFFCNAYNTLSNTIECNLFCDPIRDIPPFLIFRAN